MSNPPTTVGELPPETTLYRVRRGAAHHDPECVRLQAAEHPIREVTAAALWNSTDICKRCNGTTQSAEDASGEVPVVRTDGGRESWKPRPGNYFIAKGTWVRLTTHGQRGVVANLEDHESDAKRNSSVNILWFPNRSQWLSGVSFRQQLRDGRLVVDKNQHPYDKVEWDDRVLQTDNGKSEGGR